MGNYATTTQLETRFDDATELAYLTDNEVAGTPDTAVEEECIASAEGAINTRIGKRYKTPVASTDASVVALLQGQTLDLAEVNMRKRKPPISEQKERQADKVLEWADRVGDGTYVLPGASTYDSTVSRDPRLTWSTSDRTQDSDDARLFSRDTASGL